MRNTYSKGSEYQHLYGPPCNEDHAMLMEVISVSGGIITAEKVWDEGSPKKSYSALLRWHGRTGTPPDAAITPGQVVVFHRCGDFAGAGTAGYELHTQDATKSSWVCFTFTHVIWIEDKGVNGDLQRIGEEVYFDDGGNSYSAGGNTLRLMPIDPLTAFHNSTPPYATGRIYAGLYVHGTPGYFLVFLPGKGDQSTTKQQTVSGTVFSLSLDGQGNVLDFTAV